MTRGLHFHTLALLSLAAVLASGCPDPEARLDAFLEDSKAERDLPPPKDDLGSTLADINGQFLFALDPVINPGLPLQFLCTATLTDGVLTLSMQPLSLDQGSTTMPRQPVGDPLLLENIKVEADGSFNVDLGTVMVTGAANPLTGSDIEATLSIDGFIQDENFFCGNAHGMVTVPLMADLEGSTFGATRVTGVADLPTTFEVKCPG